MPAMPTPDPSSPYLGLLSTPPGILTDANAKRKRQPSASVSPPTTKRVRVEQFATPDGRTHAGVRAHPLHFSSSVSLPALDTPYLGDSSPISSPITPQEPGPDIGDLLPSPFSDRLELMPAALTVKETLNADAVRGAQLLHTLLAREQERAAAIWRETCQQQINVIELRNKELQEKLLVAETLRAEERGRLEEEIRRLKRRADGEIKARVKLQKELRDLENEKSIKSQLCRTNDRRKDVSVMTEEMPKVDGSTVVDVSVQTQIPTPRNTLPSRSRNRSPRKNTKGKATTQQSSFLNAGEEVEYYRSGVRQMAKEVEELREAKEASDRKFDRFRAKWHKQESALQEKVRTTDLEAHRKKGRVEALEKAMKRANLQLVNGFFKSI